MAQAVCEFGNGRLESLSAASLSGVSLSLATGFSQIQQLQPASGELMGEPHNEKDEDKEEERESSNERAREKEGGTAELKVGKNGLCGALNSGDGTTPVLMSTTSQHTSGGVDGVSYLLENVPRVDKEFEVLLKIGEGTFSSVFLGRLRDRPELQFALKHLVPTSSTSRIENELKCLQSMGGRDNVIPLLTCVRHRDHIVLVMPYFPHSKLTDYLHLMTPAEVQCYMRALFVALRNVHSHHVIHRDIKPSNFLYNRDTGQFQLVDFGLAHLETSSTSPTSSSNHLSAYSRPNLRSSHPTKSHLTPSPSSSAHITTLTPRGPHPQAHVNITTTTNLVPPSQTYRRQTHRKLHPQSTTAAPSDETRRGRLERKPGRKRGKEGEGEGGRASEVRACPMRHKKTELCDVCQNRPNQNAPRAGTPGFRAPEVLLKCPHQTTAVDIWSAGVVLLCLLSGRYPFFRASDDLSALAQIIALRGSAQCTRVSRELGKELVCSQQIEPVDLRELCQTLRDKLHRHLPQQQHSSQAPSPSPTDTPSATQQPPSKRHRLAPDSGGGGGIGSPSCRYQLRSPQLRKSPRRARTIPRPHPPPLAPPSSSPNTSSSSFSLPVCGDHQMNTGGLVKSWETLPDSAYHLLERCLELNPARRISAEEALQHTFLADIAR